MTHPVLGRIRIASPCSADWSAMPGDAHVRHCDACGLAVHTLSGLTSVEVARLLGRPSPRTCVRFYRRADGTILTADCPTGRSDRRRTHARRAGMAAALVSLWAASERLAQTTWGLVGKTPPPGLLARIAPPPDDGGWDMGDAVLEDPFLPDATPDGAWTVGAPLPDATPPL